VSLQAEGLTLSEGREERGLPYDVWSQVVDEHGVLRLAPARRFFLPLTQEKLPLLMEVYEAWRDYHEYMVLAGSNRETGEKAFVAVKCSKRGNDIYARRMKERLDFLEQLSDVEFFDNVDFTKQAYARSNLLWVTLTWDSNFCSLDEAWRMSYYYLHKFKANLENRFGKVEWLVFPQPFPDREGKAFGYPHFHILLLFKEASFNAFPHMELDEDGKTVMRFRVREKREIEVQGKWHSFVDVQAISSPRKAAAYCKRYAMNECYGSGEKATLTCAVNWLYRKQGYSLTHHFREDLHEFIVSMQLRKTVQVGLDGEVAYPVWEWEFIGVRSGHELELEDGNIWVKSLSMDEFEQLFRRKR
jgi:hypothetical protein